ncbi:hypothetical protein GCM10027514_43970 [Azotobacter armeniacus]
MAAIKAGSYHYLTKPVVLAELKLLIDKALEAQRLEHTSTAATSASIPVGWRTRR